MVMLFVFCLSFICLSSRALRFFFFYCYANHRDLHLLTHAFPTRRSSDLRVVSADVYRPAAIDQLRTLAQQVDVMFFPSTAEQKPEAIIRAAIGDAKKSYADVLIVDTAGRLAIDEAMMAEIKALHADRKSVV